MESRSTKEPQKQQQQPWSYCSFAASIAWPPRSYPCSFCEREFRSAQALGGHMNVHRRDRARLRQGSPPLPPRPAAAGSINPRWAAAAIPNLNYPPPPPSQPSLYHPGGRSHEGNERSSVAASTKVKGLGCIVVWRRRRRMAWILSLGSAGLDLSSISFSGSGWLPRSLGCFSSQLVP